MNRLQPYPVAVALSLIFLILYSACISLHLVVDISQWPMARLWEMTLFGFSWVSTLSYFTGALELLLAGFYIAYTLIPLYNYFDQKHRNQEGIAMKAIHFKPVALALTVFGVITFTLCNLFDLVFPRWAMDELWQILLPGYTGVNWSSYFIGLIGIVAYGLYIAAVFVPIYNYFRSAELAEVD